MVLLSLNLVANGKVIDNDARVDGDMFSGKFTFDVFSILVKLIPSMWETESDHF